MTAIDQAVEQTIPTIPTSLTDVAVRELLAQEVKSAQLIMDILQERVSP